MTGGTICPAREKLHNEHRADTGLMSAVYSRNASWRIFLRNLNKQNNRFK